MPMVHYKNSLYITKLYRKLEWETHGLENAQ